MNARNLCRTLIGAVAALAAATAWAHGGMHAHGGFAAGFAHPFTGLDHLLAMFAVGLWATQQRGWRVWVAPATFVAVMAAGAVAGTTGLAMAGVEPAIALSVLLFGAFIAVRLVLPAAALVVLSAAFAWFHGFAHGMEMPAGTGTDFMAGFVLATAALHASGVAVGALLRGHARVLRGLGVVTALTGAGLLLG